MVNRPGSNASRGSGYRTVSRTSNVDESLFGNTKPGSTTFTKNRDVASFEKSGTARKRAPAATQRQQEVVTLTADQLSRMMSESPILTAEQAMQKTNDTQARHEQERQKSIARKNRMLKMEEERKKQVPLTESEVQKQQEDMAVLSYAERKLAEQKDEVKAMNQMMNYSKCVTVRDVQLQEKKHMMLEAEEEQRQLDLMMEIERIKALENYEERERQRREERLKGAAVLQEQLEERQRERQRQEEMREHERLIMLKEHERLKEEELRSQVEKKLKAEQLTAEVMAANQEQIERKKEIKRQELEEEARIAEYVRMRELREQAIQEEKDMIAREKELEVSRLRAAQEKAADKQSELDELRARRHAEAAEREWRTKEAAKAARDKAIMEDLQRSREAQKAAKIAQQAQMARLEKEEFERIVKVNREKAEQQRHFESQVETLRKQHQNEVLTQISAREEARKAERQKHLEEGRKGRKEAAHYLSKVEAIKQAKLAELRASGVPEKYCAELVKYKVGMSGH